MTTTSSVTSGPSHLAHQQYITKSDLVRKASYIEKYLEEVYEADFKHEFATSLTCYKECLFFITVMFHQDSVSLHKSLERSIGRKADPLDEFGRFHFRIMESLMGKRIERKKRYQPKLFGWIDFGGTRNGHGSGEQMNPHIHAVVLVPSKIRQRYKAELSSHISWIQSGTIQDIKAEQYDPNKGSVLNLIEYCVKGLEGLPVKQAEWLELKLPPEDMRSRYGPGRLAKLAGREYRLGSV